MGLRVDPLPATFGAVVTGVRLADLDDASAAELHAAWLERALLLFPDQHLDRDEQNAFARRFGSLEFEASPIANTRADGSLKALDGSDDSVKILQGNMGWHSDSTYLPVQAKGAVFVAHTVPDEGGETAWADMRAAYDALDDATRALVDGLQAHHSLQHSQAEFDHVYRGPGPGSYGMDQEPQLRPLVKVHPETGRPALLIGRHAFGIPGLAPEESDALLARLVDEACRPPRVWEHRWSPGDVALWDNRCLLHRARAWDLTVPRVMFHARIAGDPTTEASLTAAP